ncbi:hypothetical protein C7S13_3207 [Burkholderia cepacia]|nr:hypothetical protein [Burkholderia cepacia]QOH32648.1 hypothetical protein C7S14_4590 [Burkholderia cepacia]
MTDQCASDRGGTQGPVEVAQHFAHFVTRLPSSSAQSFPLGFPAAVSQNHPSHR